MTPTGTAMSSSRTSVIVAPGPRTSGPLGDRLARHREFYLKAAHTLTAPSGPVRYWAALGRLSYRGQLALRFDATPRHTPADGILARLQAVALAAELTSVDLLRVGWEGTMWHVRYGEGASFDDACPVGEASGDVDALRSSRLTITDAWGEAEVDWEDVAETCAYVNHWMELRPDMLVLAGSPHGPMLDVEDGDAVVRFPEDEPRVGPGDEIIVTSSHLAGIRAPIIDIAARS